jgi:colanic acid/amylovoran biosynthesis glycosyltransferase
MSAPMAAGLDGRLPVIHSVDAWLGRTMAWLDTLVESLPDRVENHVVCARTSNLDEFPVQRLYCYGTSSARFQRWLAARSWRYQMLRKRSFFRTIAHNASTVVVHSHFGTQGWLDREDARAIGAAHVVSFYGYDVDHVPQVEPQWRNRYRQLFSEVDRVLCEGPCMVERVMALGCPDSKVGLHHLGVDAAATPFRPRTWRKDEPLRVLLASAFSEKKGLPYAIEALAQVRRHVRLQVSLVGDATARESLQREKHRILETIDRCGMGDAITLHGFVSRARLLELAYGHHLFVAPSVMASDGDNEGGAPMVLPLMAATGMPIVSTQHRDIPHVVRDGITGKLAAERDVAGLARCIEWFAANPARWHPMVVAGRSRIETDFNAPLQGERLAAIYREAVAERQQH